MIKTELASMILDVGHRPDLTTKTDMFIRQAEEMITREVRSMQQIVNATLVTGNRTGAGLPTYTLPSDFLGFRVVWSPDSSRSDPIEPKSLGEMRSLSSSAPVIWYTQRANLIVEFRGTPADTDVIPYDYFAKQAVIGAVDAANTLLNAHEELYLSAALFYLHKYEQNGELAQGQLDSFIHARDKVNEEAMYKIGNQTPSPAYNFTSRSSY